MTLEEAIDVRNEYRLGRTTKELAIIYNTSTTMINRILRNEVFVDPDYQGLCRKHNPRTPKLTEDEVRSIRELCSQGMLQSDIAKLFNIHRDTVQRIKSRRLWSDLV